MGINHERTEEQALVFRFGLLQDVSDVSVDILPRSRHSVCRLCLAQKRHGGAGMDVWLLDSLVILPVLPSVSDQYLQFSLNLRCDSNTVNSRHVCRTPNVP